MRLDRFLADVGIVKRRTVAARLLRDGLVSVDGHPAKPASEARPGQKVRIETPPRVRTWEVLEVPVGNVAKRDYSRYARLLSEERAVGE